MKTRRRSDSTVLRTVGGEIESRRRSCGLSQEDLAELGGIHRNTVGRIERGEDDPSIVLLSYLYFLLDCSGVLIDSSGVLPYCRGGVTFSSKPEIVDMHPAVMVRKLAQAVQSRRCDMEMSLQAAARESAIHLNSLWSFETGLVCPAVTTYYRVLRTLEISSVTIADARPVLL